MAVARGNMTLTEACQIIVIAMDHYHGLTKEKLRSIFKDLVIKVHPDRGGNPYLFDLVQQAYEIVLSSRRDFTSQTPARVQQQYEQLRQDRQPQGRVSSDHQPQGRVSSDRQPQGRVSLDHQPQGRVSSDRQRQRGSREDFVMAGGPQVQQVFQQGKQFDVQRFNQVFSEHYEQDEESKRNYNDMLKSNQRIVRDVVVYEDPAEMMSRSALQYSTIGGNQDSFTSDRYTDLYEAYTEQNPDELQSRKESYTTLDDVKRTRAAPIEKSAADEDRMRRVNEMKHMHESSRQRRALHDEQRINDHYQRLHFRLTGPQQ